MNVCLQVYVHYPGGWYLWRWHQVPRSGVIQGFELLSGNEEQSHILCKSTPILLTVEPPLRLSSFKIL